MTTNEELVERIVKEIGEDKAKALIVDMIERGHKAMSDQYSADCLEMKMLDISKEEMIKAIMEIT